MPADELSKTWREEVAVRTYEVDPSGRATPAAIARYLQEAAANHAHELELGFHHLAAKRRAWVLARLRMRFFEFPLFRNRVTVYTWPKGQERLLFLRDFLMVAADGEVLAAASSAWVLLDLERRRPLRSADPPVPSDRILPHTHALRADFGRLPNAANARDAAMLKVRRSDLDLNRHVNHPVYLDWFLEGMPDGHLDSHCLREMDIDYLAEALHGDEVVCALVRDDGEEETYRHRLTRRSDGAVLCLGRSAWKPSSGG